MQNLSRQSGIEVVGAIPWGSHFCQCYTTEADLTETLVPFFEAGLAAGEASLWVTGHQLDTAWVERSGWKNFMEYERRVNATFRQHTLVGLCTYCLDNCSASDVIDMCCQHQFALARREGSWELLESSSLQIAKDSLIRLNTELEDRVESRTSQLHSALHARDEFLAMPGHELRNPLAPIRTSTDIIRTLTPANSPIRVSADILSRQVGHLTRLVDDLLDMARVTKGQIQLDLNDVAVADIISAAVEQTRLIIDQHMPCLSVTLSAKSVRVLADATRLTQVFGNLLHNAVKYTPNGGTISIAAKSADQYLDVSVRDNGTGIPEDMLDSVFELFAQLPRSLARSEGSLGIGLTLARQIVSMHDGAIVAQSEGVNRGTKVRVRLNLVQSAARGAVKPLRGLIVNEPKADRILLVDDNDDAREAMGVLLQIHGDDIHEACDGKGALAAAIAFNPTVVILDIGLPDMDGYEVARQLRCGLVGPETRLIALTGYGQASDIAAANAAGFDTHILKPAQVEHVLEKIASFMRH